MSLATALAVGLLIGLERGWKDRSDPEGSRVAGFRTIGLIGLLGGIAMLLDGGAGFVLAAGFLGLALLLREGFEAQIDATREVSVTTMVAALTAYGLGAIAVSGRPQLAAIGGVATAFILWLRVPFHALLDRIEEKELNAFLYWLLFSIVVLPVLPNEGYGPYAALNPRTIWLMVVLISGLGFAGYLSMKWFGRRRGSIFLAVSGGMVSSTAATLALARLATKDADGVHALVGGVAIAWAMMYIRTLLIVAVLAPSLLPLLGPPLGLMWLICALGAARYYSLATPTTEQDLTLANPLDMRSAMIFTLVLTTGMVASKAAANLFGDTGLYAVAIAAGAIDIEAISLSLTQLVGRDVTVSVASMAIVFAAIANTLFKGVLAAISGRAHFGQHCLVLAGLTSIGGGAAIAAAVLT